ncbi:hypothetical protein EAG_14182 [Camponotus floridanus]|uniref:Uncharacterized protein n=1 Tax=Camponotus floridanus TaxID=104421 RepID=E2AMC8_CAMFO|nr:hypothetical protein EAG_14182 [Camponotus floridanus]
MSGLLKLSASLLPRALPGTLVRTSRATIDPDTVERRAQNRSNRSFVSGPESPCHAIQRPRISRARGREGPVLPSRDETPPSWLGHLGTPGLELRVAFS